LLYADAARAARSQEDPDGGVIAASWATMINKHVDRGVLHVYATSSKAFNVLFNSNLLQEFTSRCVDAPLCHCEPRARPDGLRSRTQAPPPPRSVEAPPRPRA